MTLLLQTLRCNANIAGRLLHLNCKERGLQNFKAMSELSLLAYWIVHLLRHIASSSSTLSFHSPVSLLVPVHLNEGQKI